MCLIMRVICLMVVLMATRVRSFVGITWGRQQSQQLVPSMVVDLLLQNEIPALRLMTSGYDISEAFAETNISLSVTLLNQYMHLVGKMPGGSYAWVKERILVPVKKGVNIVELTVGSEPFSITFLKNVRADGKAVEMLQTMRQTLDEMGLGHIKTTAAHGMDVIKYTKVPSEAEFRDDIKELMIDTLRVLNQSNSAFVLYMFPINYVRDIMKYPIEFSFFDNKSGFKVEDGNVTYTNVVELMYDSIAWAIKNAGFPNVKVIIGEIGWPTDGYPDASVENAERFYKGFLKFIGTKKGTPLRPGPIDVFLHSLSDENDFKLTYGAFQRHWGIYKADGNPKIKIDFTQKGRDVYPTQAKGIVKMPKRWCVFNGDNSDLDLVNNQKDYACSKVDCTRLEEGASCYGLSFNSKISYAFNAYFQKMKQKINECNFAGLGVMVVQDPSLDNCEFPIEILAVQDQVVQNGIRLTV